ncbi:Ubiquitin carboxyl-terminal hydrolase 11 [Nowakowskiella sp. JEL0407]|nr:Ubiquitin carboxyl-terminal hydrolase 11 [Nowakowskiella sp. JEL0407]
MGNKKKAKNNLKKASPPSPELVLDTTITASPTVAPSPLSPPTSPDTPGKTLDNLPINQVSSNAQNEEQKRKKKKKKPKKKKSKNENDTSTAVNAQPIEESKSSEASVSKLADSSKNVVEPVKQTASLDENKFKDIMQHIKFLEVNQQMERFRQVAEKVQQLEKKPKKVETKNASVPVKQEERKLESTTVTKFIEKPTIVKEENVASEVSEEEAGTRRDSKLDVVEELSKISQSGTLFPLSTIPRHDMYQTERTITITIYEKQIIDTSVKVLISREHIQTEFIVFPSKLIKIIVPVLHVPLDSEKPPGVAVRKMNLEITATKSTTSSAAIGAVVGFSSLNPGVEEDKPSICSSPVRKANSESSVHISDETLVVKKERTVSPVDSGYEENAVIPAKMKNVGLWNMGNTCYLNSTIQCLMTVEPLVNYLLDRTYIAHINTQNPLSDSKGEMVKSFAQLAMALASHNEPVDPQKFYECLLKYSSQFVVHEQHDAQEFLQHLLDNIHEDVNRIIKKPYIELPEYDDSADNEVVAAEFWNAHKARNESIIVDQFHGLYRSRMKCETCGHSSIKFDPYMSLTIEIPRTPIDVQFTYVDVHLNKFQGELRITEEKPLFLHLKAAVAECVGIRMEELLAIHIYNRCFRQFIREHWSLTQILPEIRNIIFFQIVPNSTYLYLTNSLLQVTHHTIPKPRNISKIQKEMDKFKEECQNLADDSSDDEEEFRDATESFDNSSEVSDLEVKSDETSPPVTAADSGVVVASANRKLIETDVQRARERSLQPDSDDEEDNDFKPVVRVEKVEDEVEVVESYSLDGIPFGFPMLISVKPGGMFQSDLADGLDSLLQRKGIMTPTRFGRLSKPRVFIQYDECYEDKEFFNFKEHQILIGSIGWPYEYEHNEEMDMYVENLATPELQDIDVGECIDQHLKEELVQEWRCSKCSSAAKASGKEGAVSTDATKKLDLWSLPSQYLIVHLKRFAQNLHNPHIWNKRDAFVAIPGIFGEERGEYSFSLIYFKKYLHATLEDDFLELDTFQGTKKKFALIGVVNHYGNLIQGHYTACCKRDGNWLTFDDDCVIPTPPDRVESKYAYVLFYKLVN